MRVLVAPCSFKGSLSAKEAARAIVSGLKAASSKIETIACPLADGGEGTLEILLEALGGEKRAVRVEDPLGREVQAYYGLLDGANRAIIETAQAIGLTLLKPEERDPLRASSYGVGQLIRAALDLGVKGLWIGLGGSATVDCGAGMLQALGVRLLDAKGDEIPRGGRGLAELSVLDLSGLDPRLREVELIVLCDVMSPLLGPKGARLYMPQKGATPEACIQLEQGLERFAAAVQQAIGIDVRGIPGAGAAGGLGAAFSLLDGKLTSGSEFIIQKLKVEEGLKECDLAIGGEGRVDEQTLEGKATLALASIAKQNGKPFVILCGSRSEDLGALHEAGVTAVFTISPGPITLEEALKGAVQHLYQTARQLGALLYALPERVP
jgi:glycerate kinase